MTYQAIYGIEHRRDNDYGGEWLLWDDEFYSDIEDAKQIVDELNSAQRSRWEKAQQIEMEKEEKRAVEHNILYEAGLRSKPYSLSHYAPKFVADYQVETFQLKVR